MNSKQRRQEERRQERMQYRITLTRRNESESWMAFDFRMEDAMAWCKRNIRKNDWAVTNGFHTSSFRFVDDRMCTLFTLRWA